jgi:hypothetical protein
MQPKKTDKLHITWDAKTRTVTVHFTRIGPRYYKLKPDQTLKALLEDVARMSLRSGVFKPDDRVKFLALCEATFEAKGVAWDAPC